VYLQTLKESKDILDVLVIHSAFINALGKHIAHKNSVPPEVQETMAYRAERIATVYKYLYEETEKILVDKGSLDIFVTPDQFKQLGNSQAGRPRNIALAYDNKQGEVVTKIKYIKEENAKEISNLGKLNLVQRDSVWASFEAP
jgi:hypothetical protein